MPNNAPFCERQLSVLQHWGCSLNGKTSRILQGGFRILRQAATPAAASKAHQILGCGRARVTALVIAATALQ